MHVYVASSMSAIPEAKALHSALIKAGHQTTSTWYDSPASISIDRPDEWPTVALRLADRCVQEISRAQCLVALVETPSSTGGLMFEIGLAHASGLPVFLIGAPTSVFMHLFARSQRVEDALAWLRGLDGGA